MPNDLEVLKDKANRLSDVRKQMTALDETHKVVMAPLKMEADALKGELLEKFTALELSSIKAQDGTGYTVSPVKSIAFDEMAEAQVLEWASAHNAVSLDKLKVKTLMKQGVELPEFIRLKETNTIRITNPKKE